MTDRLLIVGAGPTGLGAAHRLHELGHDNWTILEARDRVGGLARSETHAGYTYDIGGHVLFSHYPYYGDLVTRLLGADYTEINRQARIWIEHRYIPYPFQNNIRGLEPRTVYECLSGLITVQREQPTSPPANFREWIQATFGDGIARHFMLPFNLKVWATPLDEMSYDWIGERVAVVDADDVLRNVLLGDDRSGWGPNKTFRYPLRGGTGSLFTRLAAGLADHIELRIPVVEIDPLGRYARTADGRRWAYDALLSTMPLDDLARVCTGVPRPIRTAAQRLRYCGSHLVGVAVDRPGDSLHTWVYFPEPDVPFSRVTYLSNYSPHMVRRPGQTLLLTETSTSRYRPIDSSSIVSQVVDGLFRTGLLEDHDRARIVATWHCAPTKTYPVPTLDRNRILDLIQPWLARHRIFSRGRFGAWRYEIGNMDHSFMQGVEWVDHMLTGAEESIWTPATPSSTR